MERQILLYGLGGADKQYGVLRWYCIYDQDISITNIIYQARKMKWNNPSIEKVYAVDNRHGLKREYQESIKAHTIASQYEFKDLLEREGIVVG